MTCFLKGHLMNILIAYASVHGSTAEIAAAIGSILRERGFNIHLKRAENIETIDDVQAVVIGTAIYNLAWLPAIEDMLMTHTDTLREIPVWIFSSGTLGEGDPKDLASHDLLPEKLAPIIGDIRPCDVTIFGGKVDLRRLTKAEKEEFRELDLPKGDYRNWERISHWASKIADWIDAWVVDPDKRVQSS